MNPPTDYTDNDELFVQRIALQEQVDALEAKTDLTPAERASLRRHRSALEMVTYQLMQLNHGLVRSYVARFSMNGGAHVEDYIAAGQVGLLQAIKSYKPGTSRFGFWAHQHIKREVLPEVRKLEFEHMSYADFEARPAIIKAQAEMELAGETVTAEGLAARASVNVRQADRVLNPIRVGSLDAVVPGTEAGALIQAIPDSDEAVEDSVVRTLANGDVQDLARAYLEPREMFVVTRRFGLDGEPEQTLQVIGDQLKLSRETVRNIQTTALAKLSHPAMLRRLSGLGISSSTVLA